MRGLPFVTVRWEGFLFVGGYAEERGPAVLMLLTDDSQTAVDQPVSDLSCVLIQDTGTDEAGPMGHKAAYDPGQIKNDASGDIGDYQIRFIFPAQAWYPRLVSTRAVAQWVSG